MPGEMKPKDFLFAIVTILVICCILSYLGKETSKASYNTGYEEGYEIGYEEGYQAAIDEYNIKK